MNFTYSNNSGHSLNPTSANSSYDSISYSQSSFNKSSTQIRNGKNQMYENNLLKNTSPMQNRQLLTIENKQSSFSPPMHQEVNNSPMPLLNNRSKSFSYAQYTSGKPKNQNFYQNINYFTPQETNDNMKKFATNDENRRHHPQSHNGATYLSNSSPKSKPPMSTSNSHRSQSQQKLANGLNPLMRSQTSANKNMQKHEIIIDLNDYGVKTEGNMVLTTYQQQQQYSKRKNMTSNHKTLIFYGPSKITSLVYVGQNPVLKNYLKLRRLKHEELVLQINDTFKSDGDSRDVSAEGFIKVNITGNRRLDHPEEYSHQHKNVPKDNSPSPPIKLKQEKSSKGLRNVFKLFKHNNNEQESRNLQSDKHLSKDAIITSKSIKTKNVETRNIAPVFSPPRNIYNKNPPLTSKSNQKVYHESVSSNSSDKGLDLLLDTVLASYETNGDGLNNTDTMPLNFSPLSLSHMSPLVLLNENINMNRRDSLNSIASNNSSANSIRSLSHSNLQKLKLFQNEINEEKDEILERLFDCFEEVKIYDEPRKKWISYRGKAKDTRGTLSREVDTQTQKKQKKIVFSSKVEVFKLPKFVSNEPEKSPIDENDDIREELKQLTEDELMKLKSLKEVEMFQKIKNEINDYKSFEMLVHKDSVLNTHFFL
ncbi:hypothetical protein QEN19_001762 [Hanseniaspora menglaensis]